MSERQTEKSGEETLTDDVGVPEDLAVDVDAGLGEPGTGMDDRPQSRTGTESSGGLLGRLYGRTLGRVLSSRGLGVALALTLAFSVLFSLIPFVGLLGNLLGIGVAGFAYGVGSDNSRYLELLLAGAAVGGGSALLGNLLVITFGSMTGLLGLGLLGGGLAAVLGHYFGRDFRDGLTREV